MRLFSFFSSNSDSANECEIPDIYPLTLQCTVFVAADITATYTKILTDTLERTHGIPDKVVPLLWDNCVQSEGSDGLITLLVRAMVKKNELFLVYNKALGVLRIATSAEQQKIRADYAKSGESASGVFISFKNYHRTDMLTIYSAFEYCILSSLHKTVNIAKAVQIKMSELRKSTNLADSGIAVAQAKSIADALRRGADVLLDEKDIITTATPNIDPTEKAIAFLDAKRAFYLDLPMSYVSGLQTAGIGSTGEADMRAIERGLKQYFFSIIHPTLLAVFGIDTEFKSQDFRQLTSALEAIKTFDLVSDEVISQAAKRELTARLFNLDEDEELKNLEAEEAEREANGENDLPEEGEVDPETGEPVAAPAPAPAKKRAFGR